MRFLLRRVPLALLGKLKSIPWVRSLGARLLPRDPQAIEHCQPGLKLFVLPRRNKGEWMAGGFHHYEAPVVACFSKLLRPGDCIFDVGANIGFYTTLFSRLVESGTVVAFEPDPVNLDLLRKNLQLNACNNVILAPCAASQMTGTKRFAVDAATGSTGTLEFKRAYGSQLESQIQEFVTVATTTLDEAAGQLGFPSVLKIDVEGHELSVLEGARRRAAGDPFFVPGPYGAAA